MNVGDKINKLTLLKDLGTRVVGKKSHKTRFGLFQCECGNIVEISIYEVSNSRSKTCGCVNRTHDLSSEPLYNTYWGMKNRCNNENTINYKNYGCRGIKVCEDWNNNFLSFYNWATSNGWKKGLHIDRINNEGDYEPSNCQLITQSENNSIGKQRIYSNNKSGYIGVYFKNGKWYAQIQINYKNKYLGTFHSLEDAVNARINAEIELIGEQKCNLTIKSLDGGK